MPLCGTKSSMMARRLGWLAATLSLAGRAQASSPVLEWSAPSHCPQLPEVTREVEHYLGQPLATERPQAILLRGTVEATEAGYAVRIVAKTLQGRSVRSITHRDCRELTEASALPRRVRHADIGARRSRPGPSRALAGGCSRTSTSHSVRSSGSDRRPGGSSPRGTTGCRATSRWRGSHRRGWTLACSAQPSRHAWFPQSAPRDRSAASAGTPESRAAAERFLSAYPGSLQRDRITRACRLAQSPTASFPDSSE
jgi:hypothetical protein